MTSRKTNVWEEREALDEAEAYKQGLFYQKRMSLWSNSDYFCIYGKRLKAKWFNITLWK